MPKKKANKILIVEDDIHLSETIDTLLKLEGYQTVVAENGSIGVKKALEFLPDLIICDIMMPKISGFEVIEALRKKAQTSTIPFIFLTAKAELVDIRKGMTLGADDYITKPFNNEDLLNAVKVRIEKKQQLVSAVKKDVRRARRQPKEVKSKIQRLTKRELEIIGMFCRGLSCKEAANELFISYHTVSSHRKNIEKKLKLHSISSIVGFALENKLFDLKK